MDTFCIILQKHINYTSATYQYSPDKTDDENQYQFWKQIYANELIHTPYNEQRMAFHLLYSFVTKTCHHNTQTKFEFFRNALDNMFMNESTKEILFSYMNKIQRTYAAFSTLSRIFKAKHAKLQVTEDLYMNPIKEISSNVFHLISNGKKYLFSITDLVNILNNSLGNSPFFFSQPLVSKNPHNNVPFNKSDLYNIYFFIKARGFIIPPLIHAFFLADFNLARFHDDNITLIRQLAIKHYLKNASVNVMYQSAINMLRLYGYRNKLHIHEDFPKDRLVDIMRPYVELHYYVAYSLDLSVRSKSEILLTHKLRQFYLFNPCFGRKHIQIHKSVIVEPFEWSEISYNESHIGYDVKGYVNDASDDDTDHTLSDDEDDDDDEHTLSDEDERNRLEDEAELDD